MRGARTRSVTLLIEGPALDPRGVSEYLELPTEARWLVQPGILDLDGTWLLDDGRRRWRLSTAGRVQADTMDAHIGALLAVIYPRRALLQALVRNPASGATLRLQAELEFEPRPPLAPGNVIGQLTRTPHAAPALSRNLAELLLEIDPAFEVIETN